ncbi:mitochondrial 54S ribosomal protein bL32m [Aspergillus lucknowensis]|uniref:Large ribosomal subunit protein bL32m n=1 Tax=Aspergillus lucknowensis TaxID=176173 RepID=A0ABR4M6I6_9EURO
MALRLLPPNMLQRMLPRSFVSPNSLFFTPRLSSQQSTFLSAVLKPAAFALSIPGILSDIWESVLRAVPKKKTSHMKKRHRQMAGKALKDVRNLNTCPSCGQIKRSHVLCQHCVETIKKQWGKKAQLA